MNGIESLYGFGPKVDAGSQKGGVELGKEDFLSLLVTQLKNQDPLNPSDPTEFTAQLAQYSSLEQLYNINESMTSLDALSGEFGRLSALSLIDRNVVVNDNAFQFTGEQVNMGFSFQDPVTSATIYVKNDGGQSVHQLDIPHPAAGENNVQWDGKDKAGQALPPGKYTFTVIGKSEEGKEIQGRPLIEARVTGVDFSASNETLLTDNGPINMSDISRISK